MTSVSFSASGRSITLECANCGSADTSGAAVGAICAVCAEGKLRWRLRSIGGKSRAVRESELATLQVREERIERIASVVPKQVRHLPLDPDDEVLEPLERMASKASRRKPRAGASASAPATYELTNTTRRSSAPPPPPPPPPPVPRPLPPPPTSHPRAGTRDSEPAEQPPVVSGTVPPMIAAVASLLLPGLGQMLSGQFVKGVCVILVSIALGFALGLANIIAAVDAYLIAKKRRSGHVVARWDMF